MDETNEPDGSTRRDMIRKMAAGGALAWTVPTVLNAAPAGAQTGSPFPACDAGGDCVDQFQCGTGLSGFCGCTRTAEGGSFCWENNVCDQARLECFATSDCASGLVCVASCCGWLQCAAPCGTQPPRAAAGAAMMSGS